MEPAEIEQALRLHPQVREAFVVADTNGERPQLLAAVTLAFGTLDDQQLRRHLRSHLPPALVPTRLAILDEAPITRNGKVDKEAILAALRIVDRGDATKALEERIADTFAEILGLPITEPDDDFFEQGGDSLASVEAVGWIRDELGVELEISALFEHPTPRSLARHIQALET